MSQSMLGNPTGESASKKTGKTPKKRLKKIESLFWWGWLGLNQRPTGYEPAALTAELHPHTWHIIA